MQPDTQYSMMLVRRSSRLNFLNSIRCCSLYVSIARLCQDLIEHFFQEGKHPPDIFLVETKESWKVAAQQNGEQQSEQLHRNISIINIKALSCLMLVFISVQ